VNELCALGDLRVIIVPSIMHDSFAHEWKSLFPMAVVLGPVKQIEDVRRAVPITGAYDTPDHAALLANFGIEYVAVSHFQTFPCRFSPTSCIFDVHL
jgi:hypothetical protein